MKFLHCLSIAAILAATGFSNAAVVIDNLAAGTQSFSLSVSGPTATGFLGGSFADREVAFSFSTGAYDTTLNKIEFYIAIGKPILSPIQMTLSTGSSVPGGIDPVVLGSVTPASTSPTVQLLEITPVIPASLTANTLYWIHVTVPSGGAVYSFANTDTPQIESGWSLGNTWSRTPSSSWSELSSGPVARIRLTVPEPSSALLGGLGLLLLLKRKRFR
ncbi:MAG: hypothetical protein CFE26_08310 [Verrucomicrobiales bacterium VVV1]|nr:MAG: hypothetical protein CFE26_08310 [Verrucomicrobiales bacterium VVV1]